jgi:hypothetical protein
MRFSVTCDESNASPIEGRATFATDRFRFATAATRMSVTRTRPPRSGASDVRVVSVALTRAIIAGTARTQMRDPLTRIPHRENP